MKSSRLLTKVLFAAVMSAATVTSFAQEDAYQRGQAAVNKGDAFAARDAFCAIDKSYKDAAVQCTTYTNEANKALNRYKINYIEGVQLMNDGKFDQAEFKLKNVKAGEYQAQAQAKLQELAQKRTQKAQADAAAQQASNADAAAKQKLDQGVTAFNSGDFNTARGLLQQAGSGGQTYLSRIAQYEAKMAEGQRYVNEKNYSAALAAYGVAAGIASNGPGDPNGQLGRVQQMMASTSTPSNPPPTQAKAAVRDEVKKVDVGATIAAAQKALNKKEYGRARLLAGQVLAMERGNKEAKDILDALPEEQASSASVNEEDPLLAAAIQQFYQANYSDAADSLKFYIFQKGKKQGLARFYLGATLATQYYLSGESDNQLLQDARKKFKEAKGVQGFNPPEKFISPKIMRVYQAAG